MINVICLFILAAIAFFVGPELVEWLTVGGVASLFLIIGGVLTPWLCSVFSGFQSSSEDSGSDSDEGTTLYVGNLPYRANEAAVKEHFETKGTVFSVRLMRDRRTGKRKGYGFVEVASGDANKMVNKLNDSEFQERTLRVRLAKEKPSESE